MLSCKMLSFCKILSCKISFCKILSCKISFCKILPLAFYYRYRYVVFTTHLIAHQKQVIKGNNFVAHLFFNRPDNTTEFDYLF